MFPFLAFGTTRDMRVKSLCAHLKTRHVVPEERPPNSGLTSGLNRVLKWTYGINSVTMVFELMKKFTSKFGIIELTDERWRHITQFHPEVARHAGNVASTLNEPELIAMSKSDPEVFIFYRSATRTLNLAVVVRVGKPNFILTAYLRTKTNKL